MHRYVFINRCALEGRAGIACPHGGDCLLFRVSSSHQPSGGDLTPTVLQALIVYRQSNAGSLPCSVVLQESHVQKLAEWLKPTGAVPWHQAATVPPDPSTLFIQYTTKPCPNCGEP
jgi:hypothetical protein